MVWDGVPRGIHADLAEANTKEKQARESAKYYQKMSNKL